MKPLPAFIERKGVLCQSGARLGSAAFQLAEDRGVEPLNATGFLLAGLLNCCAQQGMRIDKGYVQEKYI